MPGPSAEREDDQGGRELMAGHALGAQKILKANCLACDCQILAAKFSEVLDGSEGLLGEASLRLLVAVDHGLVIVLKISLYKRDFEKVCASAAAWQNRSQDHLHSNQSAHPKTQGWSFRSQMTLSMESTALSISSCWAALQLQSQAEPHQHASKCRRA